MQSSINNQNGFDLIKKIQKLKAQINNVSDYMGLEKCSIKLTKIKQKSSLIFDKIKKKQINELITFVEDIIHLKTKQFKKRALQVYARGSIEADQNIKDSTLKNYRSMENFDINNSRSPKVKIKNMDDDLWRDRTQINPPRNSNLKLQKRLQELEEEVLTYKRKIAKIQQTKNTQTISKLCYKLGQHQNIFDQQFSYKIREKVLQIDELKQKLKRSEQKNQQLKNRLSNQQKRQQDYIQNLKNNLNNLTMDYQTSGKQNKKLQEQINKIYYVCDGYKQQVKKLLQQIQYLQRQKKRLQQNEILKMKDNNIKKQLESLELQQKYMRQMQSLLHKQKDEKNMLAEKIQQISKKIITLEQQNNQIISQNEKLSQMLEIRTQQLTEIKKQLQSYIQIKNKYLTDLNDARSIILSLQQQIIINKQKKSLQLQKKAQNLKQIKNLLSQK